jgi:hypothetical protein
MEPLFDSVTAISIDVERNYFFFYVLFRLVSRQNGHSEYDVCLLETLMVPENELRQCFPSFYIMLLL